jgi:glycosyltransferase involved in cell wall biosynthesis
MWIGTVAELHPVKGLPYAIEAIKILHEKHPMLRYLILGDGQKREALQKQITESGLEHTVFLLGRVQEAPLYGRAYDIFLLPSLSEAFGIALLEAGLARLPVVATTVGGIPEIIQNGETGLLVPPKNPGAIATATESLLMDKFLRERLGDALQERVQKEFSIERLVRDTFALY